MKSFVGLEKHRCIVCGVDYDVGVLIDKRMQDSLERETVTDYGMCKTHQDLYEKGYIALVGIDESKSERSAEGGISIEGAYYSGELAHILGDVWNLLFKDPLPMCDGKMLPMVFVENEILTMLKRSMS